MGHRQPVFKVILAARAPAAVVVFRRKVHLDRLDPMDNLVKMDNMENQDRTVPMDLNDHQWHHSRIGVSLAGMHLMASLERLDQKDRLDHLARLALLVPKEAQVERVQMENLVLPLEDLQLVNQVHQDQQVILDRKEILVQMLNLEAKVPLDRGDHLVRVVHRVNLVVFPRMENRDRKELQAHRVHLDQLAKMEEEEHPVQLAREVAQDQMPNTVLAREEPKPKYLPVAQRISGLSERPLDNECCFLLHVFYQLAIFLIIITPT